MVCCAKPLGAIPRDKMAILRRARLKCKNSRTNRPKLLMIPETRDVVLPKSQAACLVALRLGKSSLTQVAMTAGLTTKTASLALRDLEVLGLAEQSPEKVWRATSPGQTCLVVLSAGGSHEVSREPSLNGRTEVLRILRQKPLVVAGGTVEAATAHITAVAENPDDARPTGRCRRNRRRRRWWRRSPAATPPPRIHDPLRLPVVRKLGKTLEQKRQTSPRRLVVLFRGNDCWLSPQRLCSSHGGPTQDWLSSLRAA